MNFDELKGCTRCGSDACYKQEINKEVSLELCYGCGFQHNSIMIKDSDFFKEQMEILPEIYKVLMDEDEEGKIWMPTTINIKDKGMVFASGKSRDDWNWSAVKAIEIPKEDQKKYKGEKHKADMSTITYFKERDFMEALSYVEIIPG
tara:strand:+ start:435 stop:875 length:441 start_codon:yes stop_codon:yes gene_type:complete